MVYPVDNTIQLLKDCDQKPRTNKRTSGTRSKIKRTVILEPSREHVARTAPYTRWINHFYGPL